MDVRPPYSLKLILDETSFYNRIVLGTIFQGTNLDPLPHIVQTWLRNCIGAFVLYILSAFLWCFYIYYWKRNIYVPKDCIPSNEWMRSQIFVAIKGIPFFSLLPTFGEYVAQNNWTKCYPRVIDVGWPSYAFHTITYLVFVEFSIYWIHRLLHDIKPLYNYLHYKHHVYNNKIKLSPFAGLALDPIDGLLQAIPYFIALFLIPTHFTTHIMLIFLDLLWSNNIHDSINAKIWPIMGSGYHTIHHTKNRYNFGHYTIWMDWMFGTLRDPMVTQPKVS